MLRLPTENTLDREEKTMAEWQTVRLGEIVKTNQSTYSPKENWQFVNYLDTGNITMNKIDEIQYINTAKDKLPSRARRKVKTNSIIYSTVRPNQLHYGIIKEQPDNFLVSTGFTVIDVNYDKAVPDFIYYALTKQEVTEQLQAIAEQSVSAYPSLKPSDIENLELMLPDKKTQERIVATLRSIDEKIKENNAINNNLINTTDTIFFKVFLENKPTATISFTDIVQLMGGGTPKTDEDSFWNGNILFFTPKDISRSPFCISTEKHLTNEGLNNCSSRLYPPYTTFVTCRGTVGNLALAGVPMAMNQSCYALKGKNDFPALFVFSFTRYVIATMKKKASGAVFSALVTRDFEMEKVFEPNFEDAILFEKRVEPLFAQILANTNEIQQLLDLQNALLTQLSSR